MVYFIKIRSISYKCVVNVNHVFNVLFKTAFHLES